MFGLKYSKEYKCPWCDDYIITLDKKKKMDRRRTYKCEVCGQKYVLSGGVIISIILFLGVIAFNVNMVGYETIMDKITVILLVFLVVKVDNLFCTYFVPVAKKER